MDNVFSIINHAFAAVYGSENSPSRGRLIENLVFLELIRRRQVMNFELFFYKNITEVDFVLYQDHWVKELIQVTLNMDDQKTFIPRIHANVIANSHKNDHW
jgi:predicted AAA+ superfamily ATPase